MPLYIYAMSDPAPEAPPCGCAKRGAWFRVGDDSVLRWPVLETTEWEELRQCPDCATLWLQAWPEELEDLPILCRPLPKDAKRLRDIDRALALRPYCLTRLEEHYGELKEKKLPCKKIECEGKRVSGAPYCLEHLIAQRFGRHLARLERANGRTRG
jgi:hypothetical protein